MNFLFLWLEERKFSTVTGGDTNLLTIIFEKSSGLPWQYNDRSLIIFLFQNSMILTGAMKVWRV